MDSTQTMQAPSWDLSDLFSGLDDPRINAVLAQTLERAKNFASQYRGHLQDSSFDAESLLQAFDEYEKIFQDLSKPGAYASLIFSADTSRSEHGAFLQRVQTDSEAVSQQLVFFDLELASVPEEKMNRWLEDPLLAKRRHYLTRLRDQKPHQLSEPEEKILSEKALTGRSAFDRLFDQELSTKKFHIEGKDGKFSESEVLHALHDADREVRRRAAQSLTKGLREDAPRLAFIFNILIQDKAIDDRYRIFRDAEAARHLSNEISRASVDALNRAVGDQYQLVQDFYQFKKELLGYETLFDYDRYAPLAEVTTCFSYEEAKHIVLDAYQGFHPQFADLAKTFFDKHWIDAATRPGKRGGAFCAFITPDLHPYVLTNFLGTTRDVMTLAHELGHGIHACLAREQSYLDFHAPLTVCETASIFGEMLTFEALKKRFADQPKALLALYVQKIEEVFASVFRQIAMYRFEQDVHAAVRSKGEQTPEQIDALWRYRQEEMFGSSMILTKDYDCWWSYISHFIGMPFYVYAYAFGELLTLSVYAAYKKEGAMMVDRYLQFLRAGGSRSPQELGTMLGIDLNDSAFWQQGLGMIKEMIEEAKMLAKSAS